MSTVSYSLDETSPRSFTIASQWEDATPYFREVAAQCSGAAHADVRLEPGTHHIRDGESIAQFDQLMKGELSPDAPFGSGSHPIRTAFAATKAEHLVIDGQGATLLFHGLIQPFSFTHCRHLTIKNLTIDWARVPYSIGTVVSIEGPAITLEMHAEYPVYEGSPVWCLVDCDPATGQMGPAWTYGTTSALRRVENDRFQIIDDRIARMVRVGRWLVLQHIGVYSSGFGLMECAGVRFENVTFHALPGMGVIAQRCSDLTFRQFNVRPKPGRLRSINRDATHFINCTGLIDFEDCLFDAMGDDAINVHGFYYATKQRLDDRTVIAASGRETQSRCRDWPDAGDTVEFVRRADLLPYTSLEIESVDLGPGELEFTTRFKNPLPPDFEDDDLFADATRVAQLRVARCTVRNNCARGLLIQTRGAVVEDCVFDRCTGTGIDINTAANWCESIGTRDVVIRRNRFIGCGESLGGCDDASGICVRNEADQSAIGVHRRITIQDNIIEGVGNKGISVRSVDGLTVSGNHIVNSEIGIDLRFVNDAEIRRNVGGCRAVVIAPSCLKVGVTQNGEKIFPTNLPETHGP